MSLINSCMKSVPVEQAVGHILCHDITEIVANERKGAAFKKGHIISNEDVAILLRLGKENIYIYQAQKGILHENDAAMRIGTAITGTHLTFSDISEGRINFLADCHGLLQIDVQKLMEINCLDEISVATLHTLQEVQKNQAVGGTRIIPLLIEEEKIQHLENLITAPIINILPFKKAKVGIVTTGSEIYHGRIKDAFGPVLQQKFSAYDAEILGQEFTSDDVELTVQAIQKFKTQGADIIAVTGGMSVDPDDRTPLAIRKSGAVITSYGSPVFPGAMFLHGKLENTHIVGLPGCVMYHRASIFDIIVPRLLAGLEITKQDIAMLGHGGFCASCKTCHYPICGFGKGHL